jgi:hypothetical protein
MYFTLWRTDSPRGFLLVMIIPIGGKEGGLEGAWLSVFGLFID